MRWLTFKDSNRYLEAQWRKTDTVKSVLTALPASFWSRTTRQNGRS